MWCSCKQETLSGQQDGTNWFPRQQLCRHHKQYHTKYIGNTNKSTKVDNKTHKSISTSNFLNGISNDDTTTTTNDAYSFVYDRSKSIEYFAQNPK